MMTALMGTSTSCDHMLPLVDLPSTEGRFSTADYRGKRPLVLLVGAMDDGQDLARTAARLASSYHDLRQAGAEVVALLHGDEAKARRLAREQRLPLPLAWDEAGDVVSRLTESDGAGVTLYVTDRFMGIHLCLVARTADDLPSPERLVSLVEGIARECPECGVADEGWWSP